MLDKPQTRPLAIVSLAHARNRVGLRMLAGRLLKSCGSVGRFGSGTACRNRLHASAGRAGSLMIAQSQPLPAPLSCLPHHQAICHFGRPSYCASTQLTQRSLAGRADPQLRGKHANFSLRACSNKVGSAERLHVCAATSVPDDTAEAPLSQPTPTKFARRTSVKDVKVKTHICYFFATQLLARNIADKLLLTFAKFREGKAKVSAT